MLPQVVLDRRQLLQEPEHRPIDRIQDLHPCCKDMRADLLRLVEGAEDQAGFRQAMAAAVAFALHPSGGAGIAEIVARQPEQAFLVMRQAAVRGDDLVGDGVVDAGALDAAGRAEIGDLPRCRPPAEDADPAAAGEPLEIDQDVDAPAADGLGRLIIVELADIDEMFDIGAKPVAHRPLPVFLRRVAKGKNLERVAVMRFQDAADEGHRRVLMEVRRQITDADAAIGGHGVDRRRLRRHRRQQVFCRQAGRFGMVSLVARPGQGAKGIFTDVGLVAFGGIGGFELGLHGVGDGEIAEIAGAPEQFADGQALVRPLLLRFQKRRVGLFGAAEPGKDDARIEGIVEIRAEAGEIDGKGFCLGVAAGFAQDRADTMVDGDIVGEEPMQGHKRRQHLFAAAARQVMRRGAKADLALQIDSERHGAGVKIRGQFAVVLLFVDRRGEDMGVGIAPVLLDQTAQRRECDLVVAAIILLLCLVQQCRHRDCPRLRARSSGIVLPQAGLNRGCWHGLPAGQKMAPRASLPWAPSNFPGLKVQKPESRRGTGDWVDQSIFARSLRTIDRRSSIGRRVFPSSKCQKVHPLQVSRPWTLAPRR